MRWNEPCLITLPKVFWQLTGEQEERLAIVNLPAGGIELFLWPVNTWRRSRKHSFLHEITRGG